MAIRQIESILKKIEAIQTCFCTLNEVLELIEAQQKKHSEQIAILNAKIAELSQNNQVATSPAVNQLNNFRR